MSTDIPFSKVLKDPKSWDDDMDLDVMTDNYLKLKPIMDKMFFSEYPKHPQYFTLLFSKSDFADSLIQGLIKSEIQELDRIYFKEYSEEDRNRLIELGILDLLPSLLGFATVVHMRHGNNYFVCLVL